MLPVAAVSADAPRVVSWMSGLASLGLDEAVQVDEVAVLPQQILHRTPPRLVNCSLGLKRKR